jgi:hypothetical protein
MTVAALTLLFLAGDGAPAIAALQERFEGEEFLCGRSAVGTMVGEQRLDMIEEFSRN